MIEEKIFLKTLDDVRDFVAIAANKPYDIELLSGKYVVNAKSVMGVLSLDLTSPLTMVANTETDNEILLEVEKYSAAALTNMK
ncbi:MAG: HPr family phosphocarrier protein [Clostridia bacterium]|nr:HPr family phosphocarrier protein [Clostridia bacterium]